MKATTEPGAIVNTDGWGGYNGLAGLGYEHRPQNQSAAAPGEEPYLPRAHRAISNLKAWLHGTHRWASPDLDGRFYQPPTTYSADVSLSEGQHTVVVEYFEHTGGAVARFNELKLADAP